MARPLLLAVLFMCGCASAPTPLGSGPPLSVAEISGINQYAYETDSEGVEFEFTSCSVSDSGLFTGELRFENPGASPAPVVVVLAIESVGVDYFTWNLSTGSTVASFGASTPSDAERDERIVKALSTATLGVTECFAAIVGWSDNVQRSVKWPNDLVQLNGS